MPKLTVEGVGLGPDENSLCRSSHRTLHSLPRDRQKTPRDHDALIGVLRRKTIVDRKIRLRA